VAREQLQEETDEAGAVIFSEVAVLLEEGVASFVDDDDGVACPLGQPETIGGALSRDAVAATRHQVGRDLGRQLAISDFDGMATAGTEEAVGTLGAGGQGHGLGMSEVPVIDKGVAEGIDKLGLVEVHSRRGAQSSAPEPGLAAPEATPQRLADGGVVVFADQRATAVGAGGGDLGGRPLGARQALQLSEGDHESLTRTRKTRTRKTRTNGR